jgi:hypothetical protein
MYHTATYKVEIQLACFFCERWYTATRLHPDVLAWKPRRHVVTVTSDMCTLGYVQEGSIFLQQALETAASGTTIEPDEDLIACMSVF